MFLNWGMESSSDSLLWFECELSLVQAHVFEYLILRSWCFFSRTWILCSRWVTEAGLWKLLAIWAFCFLPANEMWPAKVISSCEGSGHASYHVYHHDGLDPLTSERKSGLLSQGREKCLTCAWPEGSFWSFRLLDASFTVSFQIVLRSNLHSFIVNLGFDVLSIAYLKSHRFVLKNFIVLVLTLQFFILCVHAWCDKGVQF